MKPKAEKKSSKPKKVKTTKGKSINPEKFKDLNDSTEK